MGKVVEKPLTGQELETLLAGADNARVGMIGDLCLDIYWLADMRLSEISRETPHFPLPVVEERYAPGGAGNVACNLAALKPGHLAIVGLVGTDWRGDLLLRALGEHGVDCSHIVRDEKVTTNTYIKPLRRGISDVVYEDPRLDFENRATVDAECEKRILEQLEKAAEEVDVLCVCDQMKYGCITPAVRERINQLGAKGLTVIVDSRDRAALYQNATVKPNEVEASRAFGTGEELDLGQLEKLAEKISRKMGRPALITLGDKGCFVAQDGETVRCPACHVEPPIDFCGAGDTFLAGYACMLAGGATPLQAAQVANRCSAVTIKKIGTTGTATREEILR